MRRPTLQWTETVPGVWRARVDDALSVQVTRRDGPRCAPYLWYVLSDDTEDGEGGIEAEGASGSLEWAKRKARETAQKAAR